MSRHGSLNRVYRVVWNVRRRVWQAAAETCGRQRRGALSAGGSGSASRPSAPRLASGALLLILIPFTARAGTLPDGGRVVAGDASIGRQGDTLNIDQTSRNAAIDWRSFSVGEGNTVRFNQPSRDAATLNRVTGGEVSSIRGAIEANGRVFLVNPNGVHFSSTARVDVGALVASTLDISTDDFMNGDYRFSGDSANAVINRGNIRTAQGGLVAMIAAEIVNTGDITTPRGSTLMGAGSTVTLDLGGPVSIEVKEARLNTLIEQGGAIRADGGLVYLTAKAAGDLAASVINHTGMTQARTLAAGENGEIRLMGDMDHGSVQVAGTLDAGAPASLNPEGGDGGFIETSAAKVKVADEARVTTRADQGKTGEWLIDPSDFTVSAGGAVETDSGIGADTLSDNLADNSITVQTVESGGGNGDIFVNDAVTWQSGTTLTLNAHRDIEINATIDASQGSGGKLALEYGQGSSDGQIGDRAAEYRVNAPVNLQAGQNFSTKLGSDGDTIDYTVITDLGAAGSTSGEDLQGMAGDLAGNYALGANIDASDTASWSGDAGFAPVGDGDNNFTGTFDGLGHTISDLTIIDTSYAGMFGAVGTGGRVSNVGLVGGSVEGSYAAGGLVGKNQGTIRAVYATGRVSGSESVGGLVGLNESGGTVSNAYATGGVTGSRESYYMGGLVGYNKGTVSNAYSTGAVQDGNTLTGGLVGANEGTISNAYATGAVTGVNAVGGLVGANSTSSGVLNNVYWDSATTNQSSAGINAGTATDIATTRHNHDGYGGLGTWRETAAGTGVWVADDADNNPQWVMFEGSTRPFLYSEYSTTIHNAHQLQLTALDLSATYVLAGDIDASATAGTNAAGMWGSSGFAPVGDGDNKFTGTFDGLGHTISDLTIDRPQTEYVGLFGVVGTGGTLRHLGLVGGSVSGGQVVGGLVGENSGVIENANTNLDVVGSGFYAGGLVGKNSTGAKITNVYTTGNVENTDDVQDGVGGVAGYNAGIITKAHATGEVTGNRILGGLVGDNTGTVDSVYASGSVTGIGLSIGGLVGQNRGRVINAYATGNVTGQDNAGGLVGINQRDTYYEASIENSYAMGSVTGRNRVGGLVGYNNTGVISLAYSTGSVVADADYVGGLVGFNSSSDTIEKAYYAITDASGDSINSGDDYNELGQGKRLNDLKKLETFAEWSGDIDDAGGTGTVWRLYDGFTTPLLRAFLKQVTVTVNDEVGRTYDTGRVYVSGSGYTLSDETANLLGSAEYANVSTRNAGDYSLGVSGLYSDQHGYDIKIRTGRYTVDKASLTLSAVTDRKIYDGGTSSSGRVEHTELHGGDQISNLSQSFESKNAGDNRTLSVNGGYVIDDGNGGKNYAVTTKTATGSISQREISATISATDRVYDGSLDAAVIGAFEQRSGNTGLISGDDLSLAASGRFADKNTGENKTVSYSGAALTGDDAGNYTFTGETSGSTTASISRREIGGTVLAADRVYDGTRDAAVISAFEQRSGDTGLISGDDLGLAASSRFADKNAGENKTVSYSGAALTGDDAGNYTFTGETSGSTTASISRREIGATIGAADRVYDGTRNATVSGTLNERNGDTGLINDDDLSFTVSGQFADKKAGDNKTVNYSDAALTGDDAGNYTFTDASSGTTTASISRREIGATVSAADRVYDGTRNASVSGALNERSGDTGMISDDDLSLTVSGQFTDKNAGDNKTVNYSDAALTGDDAGNYTFTDESTGTTTASISRREIGATISAADRVYDGTRNAAVSGTLNERSHNTGLISDDDLSFTVSGQFNDKNAGDNKTVNYSGAALTGDDAGNYTFTGASTGTTSASISRREIGATISAADRVYDGTRNAAVSGTLNERSDNTGLISDDDLSLTVSGQFEDKNAGAEKTVSYSVEMTGDDARNYSFAGETSDTTTASITPKSLTLRAESDSKTYDGTRHSDGNVAFEGLVEGDALNGLGQSFDSKNAGDSRTLTVDEDYALDDGNDGKNYKVITVSANGAIDQRELTISGTAATNKTYDGDTSADITVGTLSNLVEGEKLDVTASGTFDTANAGNRSATAHYSLADGEGGLASNYKLADTSGHEATIDRRVLTISGTSAANKTYDGTTTANISAGILGNLVDGENLNVSASGTFDSANAGERSATVHYTLANGDDGLASNYVLADTSGHEATIDRRVLTISGTSAADKTYDGTTSADISVGTLGNLVDGENLNISASGTFDSANAGERSATAHYTLANGDDGLASNYVLADTTGHEATIDRRVLTISGTSAANKTYDGTTTANITVGTLGNLVDGETLDVTASGQFDEANAGDRTATAHYTLADGDDGLASNYVLADTTGHEATIDRRVLTISGTSAADKTYDGTTTANITVGTLGNLVDGENLNVSASGTFDSANAGERSATAHYTLANGDDGLARNYVLADTSGHEATIDRRVLTISGTSAADKTYDGTTSADITLGALGNLVDGENLNVSASGTFDSANAGDRSATAHYTLTDGDDGLASNYVLADTTGHEATIDRRVLTVSGTSAADKTYDGTTSADITLGALGNLVDGESLNVSASGTFDSANAGERSATAHYTLANGEGGLASNYKLADTSGHEATIDRRVLTISGTSAADKTYDGTTSADITLGALGNLVDGENLNVSASGTFDSANAGERSATAHYTLANGDDGLAGNYTLADSSGLSAEITRRRIGGTVTAVDRVYDGSRQATLNGALDARAGDSGLIEGDNLKLLASGEFTDKNAGDNKTVNYSDAALTGDDAGNYTFTDASSGTTTASISRREIGATVSAADRVYDGTRDAAISGALNERSGDTGLIEGDDLSLAARGQFNDKNAAANKTVNYSDAALTGDDAGNYTFTGEASGTTTASISRREIGATISAADRVYDGTRNAAVSGTLNERSGDTGLISDDEMSLAVSGEFTDKNAGGNKTVNYSDAALTGDDAGNYTFTGEASGTTTASISRREIGATIGAADRVYDGTRNATVSGTLNERSDNTGLINGDDLSFTVSGQFADKNAGDNKTVSYSDAALTGDDAGNYTFTDASSGTITASIARREIGATISAADRVYDGTRNASVSGALNERSGDTGLISDDDLSLAVSGQFTDKNAGDNKTVNYSDVALTGDDAGNYTFTDESTGTTTASISRREIGATISAADRVYDGTRNVAVSGTLNERSDNTGLISDDDLSLAVNGEFADKNAGANKTVNYSGAALTGDDAGNYTFTGETTGTLTATITPRSVTVTADDQRKIAGVVDPALTYRTGCASGQTVDCGLVAGESLAGALSREAGEEAGDYAILQGTVTEALNANYLIDFVPGELVVDFTAGRPLQGTLSALQGTTSRWAGEEVGGGRKPAAPFSGGYGAGVDAGGGETAPGGLTLVRVNDEKEAASARPGAGSLNMVVVGSGINTDTDNSL